MIGCIDCTGRDIFRSDKSKMGRTTRSSKTEKFFCLETAKNPFQRVTKSKNKPSENNTESNLLTSRTISDLDLDPLNVASSVPVFDENEAVDDPNDNSLEFDDEGGNLLESNDMDVPEDPMEDVVAPKGKRKARGKDIDWIFHESFEDNTSFIASEFHKGFLDQFSIKTRNEHLYGEVSVYICKYARKRHFEKFPMQVWIVYSGDDQ